jgi:hypothetical protein
MSKDAKPMVKTNQTLLEKVIPQPLEKFITAALAKIKNAWLQENAMTGIQFCGEMDD